MGEDLDLNLGQLRYEVPNPWGPSFIRDEKQQNSSEFLHM